jgi:hypothetical protein
MLAPRVPEEIEGLTFCRFPVQHSLRCPAVGYRSGVGQAALFYVPDVAAIPGHARCSPAARCSSATAPRSPGRSCADATACCSGTPRSARSCGSEIVGGDERRLGPKIRAFARECGVSARIAYDGLEIQLS